VPIDYRLPRRKGNRFFAEEWGKWRCGVSDIAGLIYAYSMWLGGPNLKQVMGVPSWQIEILRIL
jgi:hypothetical protein